VGVHRHSHHARLRAALLGTTALVVVSVAVLAGAEPAAAQSYDWGGPGSTTTTPIYNLNTNWANPPTGAPPIAAGQSAVFDTNGSNTVTVTTRSRPIAGRSTRAHKVTIFPARPLTSAWWPHRRHHQQRKRRPDHCQQHRRICCRGPSPALRRRCADLSGNNSYSGGTLVSFGTLQVTNGNSVGTGPVTLEAGLFQNDGSNNLSFSNGFTINNTFSIGSEIDNGGKTLTLSVVIANGTDDTFGRSGTLTFMGPGTTILTASNTYTGGTFICSCSTLQLGTLALTGSIVRAVNNEGVFNVVNSNTSLITSITNKFGGETHFFNDHVQQRDDREQRCFTHIPRHPQ
jgi:autotransporter-associated beta strand protein